MKNHLQKYIIYMINKTTYALASSKCVGGYPHSGHGTTHGTNCTAPSSLLLVIGKSNRRQIFLGLGEVLLSFFLMFWGKW